MVLLPADVRKASEKDFNKIWARLYRAFEGNPKAWIQEYTVEDGAEVIYSAIESGEVIAVVVKETYLVCYRTGSPWYGNRKLLEECLVMRIADGEGKFDDVVEFLESEATRLGCCGVSVSTALAWDNEGLARKYEKYGFQRSEIHLYKSMR